MQYNEEKLKSIGEALEDSAFAEKLRETQCADEIKAAFQEKGIEVDDEFAQSAFEKKEFLKNGGELSAEELEWVAGGKKSPFKAWLATVGGAVVGGALGGPGGAVAGAIAGTALYAMYG